MNITENNNKYNDNNQIEINNGKIHFNINNWCRFKYAIAINVKYA